MADPHIEYIDPSTVKKDTAVTVKIIGSNFDELSAVIIYVANPIYKYVSPTEIRVELSAKDTSPAGTKTVLVHNNDGTISNKVSLTIV